MGKGECSWYLPPSPVWLEPRPCSGLSIYKMELGCFFSLILFLSFLPIHSPSAGIEPRDHPPPGPHACEASIYHCAPSRRLVQSPALQASEVLPHTLFLHLLSTGTTGLAALLHRFYKVLETEPKDVCTPGDHFASSICGL